MLQADLFWITIPGQMETIRYLMPFGSPLQACMKARTLWLRGKGQKRKGSTPGWSHPLQITICTRHLRTELSSWREDKQREKWERVGKMWPGPPGCFQVFMPGCQSYCTHRCSLSNLRRYCCKNTANQRCPCPL